MRNKEIEIKQVSPREYGDFLLQVLEIAFEHPLDYPGTEQDPLFHNYKNALFNAEGATLVAASDDVLLGAAWYRNYPEDLPGYADVNDAAEVSIGIIPEERGKGIGLRLLQDLVEVAVNERVEALCLDVLNDNYAAIELYMRVGFQAIREGEDSMTMILDLNEGMH